MQQSWNRLLVRLREETAIIKEQGSACLPEIDFADLKTPSKEFQDNLRRRGVAIVRQVVPEKEAREYKEDVERYVAANPSTKGKRSPSFVSFQHMCSCLQKGACFKHLIESLR